MPKFVIQREYLLPVYQYLVIEADTFEEACAEAVGPEHDWDTQEMDSDSARATTITNAKVIPEEYDVDHFRRILIASRDLKGLPLDMVSLATFLYENDAETGRLLEIPELFTDDE